MANQIGIMAIPRVTGKDVLGDERMFVSRFGSCSDAEWKKILIRSAAEPVIDGVWFPGFPDQETQKAIHGSNSIETTVNESFSFYQHVKGHIDNAQIGRRTSRLLDFGCGWGRIHRPFMREVPLDQIYAYEPNIAFCIIARKLNPYITVLHGGYLPDGSIPAEFFDYIVGWSIFSHLSELCAKEWLKEFARVSKGGAMIFMTTWGERFLDRLYEESKLLASGHEIDWYSKICIEAAGDLKVRKEEFNSEEFVWFTNGQSDLYGEAFLSEGVLKRWIKELNVPFDVKSFDHSSLYQDCFILKKT